MVGHEDSRDAGDEVRTAGVGGSSEKYVAMTEELKAVRAVKRKEIDELPGGGGVPTVKGCVHEKGPGWKEKSPRCGVGTLPAARQMRTRMRLEPMLPKSEAS